jgi:hypothetical protein
MVQRLREIFESVEREGTWSFVDSFQAQADSGDPEIVLLFVSKEAS